MKKYSVGIFGSSGVLGSNLFRYFSYEKKIEVFGFDLVNSANSFEQTAAADYLFLCLPTPYKEGLEGYDLTALIETLQKLPDDSVAIIKSTVIPGTTEKFQADFPNLNLLFCPEFLTEKYAWEDTIHPDTSIIGYTEKTHRIAQDILDIMPEAPKEFIMPASEAEMVKIARNNYFVNKLVFMNVLYDLCEASGIDYNRVRDAFASDRRIRRSHTHIFHQGGRGGGGTCFTKDAPAFRDFANQYAKEFPDASGFIDMYVYMNKKLLDQSGKETGRQYG